ncbi:MAG: hypothetical protein IVW56_04320 [Candidatus Binataceae bacterium]|nr:hypothetical protein [Candidatus Binataceae bacterium]
MRKLSSPRSSATARIAVSALAPALAGCDPVIDIAGANFPGWLVCAIAGIIVAAAMRPLFVALKLEPHLGPLMIVYPCLALLAACATFLIFFNRI